MCRQNLLWCAALVAFGGGILVGLWLDSGFWGCCLGIAAIVGGLTFIRR